MTIHFEVGRRRAVVPSLAPLALWVSVGAIVALIASCSGPGPVPEGSSAPELATPPTEAAPTPTVAPAPASAPGTGVAPGTGTIGTAAAAGPEGAPPTLGTAGPAAGTVAPVTVSPATGSPGTIPAASGGKAITATTRRTAEGLPEPIPAYQTWYRLPPAAGLESPHLAFRQAYILLPSLHKAVAGQPLTAPLSEGTTIVLEAKSPTTDFVEEISILSKTADGWARSSYARSAADLPFTAVAAPPTGAASCASCHTPDKGTEGIYSTLRLE